MPWPLAPSWSAFKLTIFSPQGCFLCCVWGSGSRLCAAVHFSPCFWADQDEPHQPLKIGPRLRYTLHFISLLVFQSSLCLSLFDRQLNQSFFHQGAVSRASLSRPALPRHCRSEWHPPGVSWWPNLHPVLLRSPYQQSPDLHPGSPPSRLPLRCRVLGQWWDGAGAGAQPGLWDRPNTCSSEGRMEPERLKECRCQVLV